MKKPLLTIKAILDELHSEMPDDMSSSDIKRLTRRLEIFRILKELGLIEKEETKNLSQDTKNDNYKFWQRIEEEVQCLYKLMSAEYKGKYYKDFPEYKDFCEFVDNWQIEYRIHHDSNKYIAAFPDVYNELGAFPTYDEATNATRIIIYGVRQRIKKLWWQELYV